MNMRVGPILLPPSGGVVLERKVTVCWPLAQPLTILFQQEGHFRISDRTFFGPEPFPEGAFGAGSALNGFLAKAVGTVTIHFEYEVDGTKQKVEIEIQVQESCVEVTKAPDPTGTLRRPILLPPGAHFKGPVDDDTHSEEQQDLTGTDIHFLETGSLSTDPSDGFYTHIDGVHQRGRCISGLQSKSDKPIVLHFAYTDGQGNAKRHHMTLNFK